MADTTRGRFCSLLGAATCAFVLAGCAVIGAKDTSVAAAADPAKGPCDPACCCRFKDNYYVRYRCSLEQICVEDGGRCMAAGENKCRSAAPLGD